MTRTALAPLVLLLCAAPAAAHPLPNLRYDRTVAVRLSPTGVKVTYTLDVSWFTMHLDGSRLLTPDDIAKLDKTERGYATAYARRLAPEVAGTLRATVDGKPLVFRVEKIDIDPGEHLQIRFVLRADWPPGPKRRSFAFEDETFEGKSGVMNLTIDREGGPDSGVELVEVDEPPLGLRNRPSIDLKPEEAAKLRKASAVVELPRAIEPPPEPKTPGIDAPAPPRTEPVVTVNEGERRSLVADLFRRGLPALFDSSLGVGVLLLAAFLFGSAHAFTPGHGKTLVAAYLVGERGTVGHAVILAVATTVAHTGSVIAVAMVLWSVYGNNVPGATQGVLQFAGGFLVAGVGLWLLMRRVTGKADHFHLFAGHHHHHGDSDHHHHHDHDHHHHHGPPPESAKSTGGWVRLVLMGLGGGLIPCWDAVLLLIAATSLNRVGFAVPLLIAFSAGLGAVLVALGVGVVYAHRAGATRFKESRWFKLLPMVSAVLLVTVGFWLCQEGLRAAMK
jgi:ABC-type nickel/cobalt efflux system permease component RcnA